jgi:hypothetical protein
MKPNPRKVDAPAFEIYLRIKHPSINPTVVTDTLGIEPEQQRVAGSAVSEQGLQTLHSESYWIARLVEHSATPDVSTLLSLYASMMRPTTLTRQEIVALSGASRFEVLLLTRLMQLDEHTEFLQQLNREGGSVTVLIQLRDYSALASLSWQTLGKLAELGIGIELN